MIYCATIVRILVLLLYGKMLTFGFVLSVIEEKQCIVDRYKRMHRISCTKMELREVPRNLKSFVELLNLQFNRIRWLDTTSFENYKDVKYLSLAENMIQTVEPGTFKYLRKLEEIDLAFNSLTTLPMELLNMPSLRNIYIEGNIQLWKDLDEDLKSLDLPISAPLEYINMADCRLKKIPNFGLLPYLWQINVSMNPLTELDLNNFANMCNLKVIDLMKSKMSPCTCLQTNSLFLQNGVDLKFVPVCTKQLSQNECPLPYSNSNYTKVIEACKKKVETAKLNSTMKISVGSVLGVIILLLLIYWCVRSSKKKREKRKKAALSRKPFVISPKNVISPTTEKQESVLLDRYFETA